MCLGMLAGVACASPGERTCAKFHETIAERGRGDLNTFEFQKEIKKVADWSKGAERDIQKAASNLLHAANTVSEVRLEVSVAIIMDRCVSGGYLEPETSS